MRLIVDCFAFQLAWLPCVGGAAKGLSWFDPLIAAILLGVHAAWSSRRAAEARRRAAVGLLGLFQESSALEAGPYRYASAGPVWWLPPAWIVSLWVLMAAVFDSSLAWMIRRSWFAAAFGAVGGQLSFRAGVRMGAARFLVPGPAGLVALAALLAAALPQAFRTCAAAGKET